MSHASKRRPIALLAVLGLVASCSSGGGGSKDSGTTSAFHLSRISVGTNAVWEINREIEFTFSLPVDFLTVNSNTISIRSIEDVPATGTFRYREFDTDGDGFPDTTDKTRVVFQPNCPTQADLSDAGLAPGGVTYRIEVLGTTSGTTNTVRSSDGRMLAQTQSRTFYTSASLDPTILFQDKVAGPPVPVVRLAGSSREEGISYVEIGANPDPDGRLYFEFDGTDYETVPGPSAPARAPLNQYSTPESQVAVLIEFNQPINPASSNISDRRLRLEYRDGNGDWQPIDTRVDLIANCTETGARVRLEPLGLLPADSAFRAVVRPGFQDIVGQGVQTQVDTFGITPTVKLSYASLNDPDAGADGFVEDFDFGGTTLQSFEDTEALFDSPRARWGQGELTAAFDFTGTGGPKGTFDWVVKKGQTFVFDTSFTSIVGGPDGIPTDVQNAIGGFVDIRNLVVEDGGTLRIQGPNPMQLNATGSVRIDGLIDIDGFNAKDVATLNTGHQPETGGAGAAGGGAGGDASEITNSSTPRGGRGFGPFQEIGTGGQGGESGYARDRNNTETKDMRRPGGGGGGRFAVDFANFKVENGYDGHPESRGAETRQKPAKGGEAGLGPFRDGDDSNDFFGTRPIVQDDGMGGFELVELVRGELTRQWAGYGGGGGGDALPSTKFPTPRWNPGSDEKGGGGGGGGGSLRIRSLGPIVFGETGLLRGNGGEGGTGENTSFLDHVGGTGGSGSGGHIILESATTIDFTDGFAAADKVHIVVRGGNTVRGSRNPSGDPVPTNMSYGGAGGPGVIQLHVPSINPPSNFPDDTDILVSASALMHANGPLYPYSRPPGVQLIPTFGATSKARSRWISIGGASEDASGGAKLVSFLFEGTDTAPGLDEGKVLSGSNAVTQLAPILGPETIPSATVVIQPDGTSVQILGASLDPLIQDAAAVPLDIYLRTPALLEQFTLSVTEVGNPQNTTEFIVAAAEYDDVTAVLTLHLQNSSTTLAETVAGLPMAEYELVPHFFRVVTDGIRDFLPDSAFVRITFEGASDDGFGGPDEENLLVPATADISEFNAVPAGDLQFFRFEVEFNLDAPGTGIQPGTKPVNLEFLKIPFRF